MNSQQYGMVQVDNNRYRFFYDVSGQYLIEQVTAGYEICNRQGRSITVRSLKLASQYVVAKITSKKGRGRMKATRKDHVIIKCARRLINKLDLHRSYTCDDEFAKDVQLELERLKGHCEQARKADEA